MEGKQLYRLLSGTHMDSEGTIYLAGVRGRDQLYLTDDKAGRMEGRVQRIEEVASVSKVEDNDGSPLSEDGSVHRDWSFIRDRKATEVIDIIKALDDRDDLLAVRAEEGQSQTPRSGVLKAIQTRLSQLEGE